MNIAALGRYGVILFALSVILPSAQASGQDKLRLGLSSIGATNGSIWAAEEKGLFRKHGVDVEVIFIGGGGARVVSSLLAGDINFSVGGGEGSIRSQMRGAETVIASSTLTKGCNGSSPSLRSRPIKISKAARSASLNSARRPILSWC